MKRIVCYTFLVIFMILLTSVVSIAVTAEKLPKAVLMGSMAASGTTPHTVGIALGSIIEKHSGIRVTAEPGDALYRRANLVRQGEYALLLGNAFDAYMATFGQDPFKGRLPIRNLMTGHKGFIIVGTTPDSGIKKIPDVKGKRVAFDYTDAAFLNVARKYIFEAYGIGEKDYLTLKGATSPECNQTLIERRSDAIVNVFSGVSMVIDRSVGLYIIPLGAKEMEYVHEKVPPYMSGMIPVGYFGYKTATPTIAYNSSLYCPTNLSDELAYIFVKSLLDHSDEMAKVNPIVAQWTLKNAVQSTGIPFHNGAIKYFKEKGVWTDAMEKRQKEILRTLGETI